MAVPIPLLIITFLGIFAARLYEPVKAKYHVLGFSRPRDGITNIHGERMIEIPRTPQCEDLHHHLPSGLLFTACEDEKDYNARRHWFPPLTLFDAKYATGQGKIVIIDPKTFQSTPLSFENFNGPFITHGIDVISSPKNDAEILIFAVNHLAHPDAASPNQAQKAASQVEVFAHTLGSSTARHVRSVAHPSITTPNDLHATGPNSFYVTNDHHYRDGALRLAEDAGWRGFAAWSNMLHVTFDSTVTAGNATTGVKAEEALKGLHNNNGLGHSERDDIVLIGSAASGELTRAQRSSKPGEEAKLTPIEHIQLDTSVDNPSYFKDEYETPGHVASGYVLAGLVRAIDLPKDVHNEGGIVPSLVQILRRNETVLAQGGEKTRNDKLWLKPELVFQDDGKKVSGAATAVLVGVDPKESGGKKQGWLFVTGFMTRSVVAALVDL